MNEKKRRSLVFPLMPTAAAGGRVFHGVKEARTKIRVRRRARRIDREKYRACGGGGGGGREGGRERENREKESNGRLSGAKWSGEVGDLLLARGLCSFGFLPVAPPERRGGGERWLRPRNINTLNSLSTLAEPEHMLTSYNYALLLFRPARVGERTTAERESQAEGWHGRFRANASLSSHFGSNNKTVP